jgi:hypothetical protein
LFGDLLRSWHTHPAGLVAALLCAETAHLADDRFRHLSDLRSDASYGDIALVRSGARFRGGALALSPRSNDVFAGERVIAIVA